MILLVKTLEIIAVQRVADLLHQIVVEIQIVQNRQAHTEGFLCLDEVDSTISSVNYDKLTELYRRILTNYQFIIHIVHNELLADIHDMTITVVKEGNVSKIQKIS